MGLNKRQMEFLINSDVEELVSLLQEDKKMSLVDAFAIVYNSDIYRKLLNERTGLYEQSALYLYEYLQQELSEKKESLLEFSHTPQSLRDSSPNLGEQTCSNVN